LRYPRLALWIWCWNSNTPE